MTYVPPNPNGQAVMASSEPVVIASNQSAIPAAIDQTTPGTTNGVQITALTYPQSTGNNTTAQLAASAIFTGTIETVLSLQAAQIMVTCDQPYTVFIDQFIDLAGTKLVETYTFTRLTGVPLNENVTLPGNYMRVRVQNTGSATTTTFRLDTTFGIMDTQPNTLSNNGNLRTVSQENGIVSTVNSTATNLAGAAVFTGTSEDVTEYSTVFVSAFSSHASATDGLSVQFSSDGTNWDLADVFTIPAATGKVFSFGVQAKFYRLVYTNGATLTTSLRIQTLFSRASKKFSSQRPQDARTNDNDFEENLNYLMGFNGTTWDRVRSSVKGTQGAFALATQDLKDSGRNARHFMLDAFTAAPAVEAVQSVVQWYNNAAVAGTTQPVVIPAGKTLRLIGWSISTKSLATVGSAVVRVRVNTAGLGVLASPLVFSFEAGSRSGATTVAMTGGMDTLFGSFPEGFEIPAGAGLSFSMAGYGPTGTLAVQGVTRFGVYGYEY